MATQNDRIEYIVQLIKKIEPTKQVNADYMMRGTSIRKLCEYDTAPYQRIKSWAEKKVSELTSSTDMEKAKLQFEQCFEVMKGRNQSYGSSWNVLSVQSIANLIEMKMNRIAKLGVVDTKAIDEFIDATNYAIFALIKLKK